MWFKWGFQLLSSHHTLGIYLQCLQFKAGSRLVLHRGQGTTGQRYDHQMNQKIINHPKFSYTSHIWIFEITLINLDLLKFLVLVKELLPQFQPKTSCRISPSWFSWFLVSPEEPEPLLPKQCLLKMVQGKRSKILKTFLHWGFVQKNVDL